MAEAPPLSVTRADADATTCTAPDASSVALLDGRRMPSLALGTWRSEPSALKAAVKAAVVAGYRHIDTAAMYGNESIVGDAIAELINEGVVSRGDLFIVSKLMPTDSAPEDVLAAVKTSLAKLRCDYIDLYLLHWPFRFVHRPSSFPVPVAERLGYSHEALLATWRALEETSPQLVRSLGVSNCTREKLEPLLRDARVPPVCNQLELHPYLQQCITVDWCLSRGIVVTGYCPLGSPARPPTFRDASDPPVELLAHPSVLRVAGNLGCTPAQALLAWAIRRCTLPLPKSTTPARIIENAAAAALAPRLQPGHIAALDALECNARFSKGAHFCVADQEWQDLWDGTA